MAKSGYRHEMTVCFGDCDPADIVFYPNYFRWFDAAIWAWCREFGLDRPAMRDKHGVIGMPSVKSHAEFRAPAQDGDRIAFDVRAQKVGRSSVEFQITVSRGDTIIAEGVDTRVWSERLADGTIKSCPIPDEVRSVFLASLDHSKPS